MLLCAFTFALNASAPLFIKFKCSTMWLDNKTQAHLCQDLELVAL